jgi:hypothetical protein
MHRNAAAWILIASSLAVTCGVVAAFHVSGHLPIDEPWLVVFAFLPQLAAAAVFTRSKTLRSVGWIIWPWLFHDAIYLMMFLVAGYTWTEAVYWRATHGLMLIFIGAPTLVAQVWLLFRKPR